METSNQNCESLENVIDGGFPLEEVFLYSDDTETDFLNEVVLRFAGTYIKISATLDDTVEIMEIGLSELKPDPLKVNSSSSLNV